MLPAPVSFGLSSSRRRRTGHERDLLSILLARSRTTNLAVILLGVAAAFSIILNLSFYYSAPRDPPSSLLATIHRDPSLERLNHLVLVPGHSIWNGSNSDLRAQDDQWMLEPYQKGTSAVTTFFKHIEKGAELALEDPQALLVFSGGQTRALSTTTEGEAYLRLALAARVLSTPDSTTNFRRVTTENYALDSFQNLLFSIARFQEFTGHYPSKITVVGYGMKRERFTTLHRAAIRWPEDEFEYVGIDAATPDERAVAKEGEQKNGYLPYIADPYGCQGFLLAKRQARNLFARYHPYYSSSPGLRGLLEWCPYAGAIFKGTLPW